MSVLIFLVVLFVLVLVHEFGHFIVAKKSGMRVDEFGIGFPPKLMHVRYGETLYTLNAFPLGGFVRIYGENGNEETDTANMSRAFMHKSKIAQALVLVAGVTMNVLFAWMLFTGTYIYGVQMPVETEHAGETATLTVLTVLPGSPAERAGLMPNDSIVRVANAETGERMKEKLTPESVSAFVSLSDSAPLSITILRHNEEKVLNATAESLAVTGEDNRLRIGIRMGLLELKRYPILTSARMAFTDTWQGLYAITVGTYSLVRDAILLKADLSSIAGPIGIAGLAGDASKFGFSALLTFTAFISLNLAVINMLPLPALDGGRLVMVAFEAVRGKRVSARVAQTINVIGFFLIIALMLAVTYNDIVRLL